MRRPVRSGSRPPPIRRGPAPAARPPRRRRRILIRLIGLGAVALLLLAPAWVLIYRFLPPPGTALMVIRAAQGQGLDYRWRPLTQISPELARAVIAAEDARFCDHRGFDLKAMQRAAAHNEARPGRLRGGSTLDQQTAKNVFLWPGRDYVRKTVEAGFTVLEEALWGKRRILEIYLNVVEWGPGLYGAEAAAQRYFHESARALTPTQSARLAAILPRPLVWRAVRPGAYVRRRSARIGAGAEVVRDRDLAWCAAR